MQMFKLFQITLGELGDTVNELGWWETEKRYPKVHAYLETTGPNNWQPDWMPHYDHVASIDAEDLDHAYEIGNLGTEIAGGAIERLAPMHSISVGDLLEDASGARWMVAPCGFTRIETPEAA